MYYSSYQQTYMDCFKNGLKNEDLAWLYSLGRIGVSSLGQRGSVRQKVSITGFLDRVGHLGGVIGRGQTRWHADRRTLRLYERIGQGPILRKLSRIKCISFGGISSTNHYHVAQNGKTKNSKKKIGKWLLTKVVWAIRVLCHYLKILSCSPSRCCFIKYIEA